MSKKVGIIGSGIVLQRLVPDAHFVKAFNSVGNALMVNPGFRDNSWRHAFKLLR